MAAPLAAMSQPAGPSAVQAPVVGPAPAAPGVFSATKQGQGFRLAVKGKTFTSQEAIEQYLAYRAAALTMEQKKAWFTLVERRTPADKAAAPRPDPSGPRYSFRLEYFRPVWRYKTADAPVWKSWNPLSGVAFFAEGKDPKTVTEYEVTVDIVPRAGVMTDYDPLAFDASAVSDYLINQVAPPA